MRNIQKGGKVHGSEDSSGCYLGFIKDDCSRAGGGDIGQGKSGGICVWDAGVSSGFYFTAARKRYDCNSGGIRF